MSGSAIFDLAVGIVFVFLLVSMVCSQVGNKVSTWLRWRSKDLEAGIRNFVLSDDGLSDKFFNSALIQSLVSEDNGVTRQLKKSPLGRAVYQDKIPAKLAAKTFVQVLFSAVVPAASGATTIDELIKAINGISNPALRDRLLPLVTRADDKIDTARKNIENWYDLTMEKTTEIYKRHMWGFAFFIAALVTLILNVDTLAISTRLWQDSALRTVVAGTAQDFAQKGQEAQALATLQKLDLPIGWQVNTAPFMLTPADWVKTPPKDYYSGWALKLIGWLIMMFAGAQGAPFWFDLLRKMTSKS